jgi:hypothetical protein
MSAVPKSSPNQKRVLVQHHEGGKPSVDHEEITLDRTQGDEMHWICDHPGKKFRVTFDKESPFARSTFDETDYQSGPIRPDARRGAYKYSVEINGHVHDPKVIVQP